MALNQNGRVMVFRTVREALQLIWTLRTPYLVLTLALMMALQLVAVLGLFEPLNTFAARAQTDPGSVTLAEFPVMATAMSLAVGFAVLSAFGVLWYRYLLLGRATALKINLRQFGATIWRFSGYGFAIWILGTAAVSIGTLVACLLGALVPNLLGLEGRAFSFQAGFLTATYYILFSLLAQVSLIFPALAVGEYTTFGEMWRLGRKDASAMMWAILVACVPFALISFGIHSALSLGLGVDLLSDDSGLAGGPNWWIHVLLSPVSNFSLAAMLGVIALSYRDLAGGVLPFATRPATETVP